MCYSYLDIIYIDMKSYCIPIILLALLTTISATKVNTTSFWQQAMNQTQLHFQSYSGFQQIDQYFPKGQSGIYYSLFGAATHNLDQNSTAPLILWLNGGPGSSSHFGAFMELGPIRILQKKPRLFSYPWNNFGHLLFVDQPLNVGFSFQGNRTGKKQVATSNQAAKHMLNFLQNFYMQWPQLKSCPLFITGQSFAGHYIPALVSEFIIQDFGEKHGIHLQGVAIGDGWVDPINQVNFYDSLLYSAGIVSNKFRDVCTWMQTQSIVNIYKGDLVNATSYWDFLTNDQNTWKNYLSGMSQFNFRQFQELDTTFATFLNQNKKSLGVTTDISYIPGNQRVYQSFHADISTSYTFQVNIMLRHARVLFYNGQEDYVVNTAGVLNYLNSLSWQGVFNWKKAPKQVWTVNGLVKGWAKVSGNMWFVLVNRAGHMVPTDNPSAAFSMMGHFIHNDRNWSG